MTALAIARLNPAVIKPFNFVVFQFAWWICILAAAREQAWPGLLAFAMVIAIHLALTTARQAEIRLLLAAIAIGAVFDSLLVQAGWIVYAAGGIPALAPAWIIAMWAGFATTINVSLGWLHDRYALAAVFGALGGPLSYWGGAQLGAATLTEPLPALSALAFGWAAITPLLFFLGKYFLYKYRPDKDRPGNYFLHK